jgi:hypothetical protein
MKLLILILLSLICSKAIAMEEVLLDIINGIWAAERINELCPDNLIALPASEEEITASLIEATGQDFVGEVGKTIFHGEMTLRDHAKSLVNTYYKDGCNTATAEKKRAAVIEELGKYDQIFMPQ